MLLLALLVSLSVSLVSCRKGARVTVCIVDAPNYGFQCADSDSNKKDYFLPLSEGKHLRCMSPEDTESFLKACKQGQVVEGTECIFEEGNQFVCRDLLGREYPLVVDEADNFFCVSKLHKERIIDRCENK